MALDREDIEAIAAEIAELLERREPHNAPKLIDAAELARRFGMERSWVYSHAAELGAMKLGTGPGARLRFDPQLAAQALTRVGEPPPAAPSRRPPARRWPVQGKVPLLPIKGANGSG